MTLSDAELLDAIAHAHALLDPPPADLDDRVRFAIALESITLENLDVEVSRLQTDELVGSGARGTERTRTVTFDSETLTIMVTITDAGGAAVRLDGWLAPPGSLRVELRTSAGPGRHVTADDVGRFVFEDVAHGLAQLLVHPEPGRTVVTPSLVL